MQKPFLRLFSELNQLNKDKEFVQFREQNLKNILVTVTIISVITILGFHLVDRILVNLYNIPHQNEMMILRIITSGLLVVNLAAALIIRSKYRLFIYNLFYISAIFSTVLSYFSTMISSSYWGGLGLSLIIWFVFVPFGYRKQLIHALIFTLQYYIIYLIIWHSCAKWEEIAIAIIILTGTFVVGTFVAVYNNRSSASIFYGGKALKESEEKYKALIEKANDGIVIIQDGIVKFINHVMAEILGFRVAEMLNTSFLDYLSAESKEKVSEMYRRRQAGEHVPQIHESVLVDKRGKKKDVEFNSSIITYNGKIATQTFIRDITERKRSEEKIIESEEKFRTLSETAQDAIIMLDNESKITYWNFSSEKIFGYAKDEVLGKYLNDVIIPKRLCCSFDIQLKRYLEKGESDVFPQPFELQAVRKNGEEFFCEFNLSSFQVKGQLHAVAMFHDITERKLAAIAQHEVEERFSIFMDNMPAAVYLKDTDGRFLYVNKYIRELTGKDDLIGKKSSEYLPADVAEKIELTDEGTFKDQSINIHDEVVTDKSGNEHNFKTSRFIIKRNNKPDLLGGIAVDITDHIIAEEKLRKINEKLSFFIQQTPLAYIEWNEKLEVTDWNAAAEKMFGYTRNEAINMHAYKIIVPEEARPHVDKVYMDLINQKGGSYSLNENITKDGQKIICEWYNTPLKDKDGQVIGLASVVQDVTERKRIEEEREKSVAILEKDFSTTKEQMRTYFTELQLKKNELLRLQKENLQSQFETLKNQVNPHFLFNSLNVLASLISVDPEMAEQFTGRLSKIYRYVLEYKSEDLINLRTEIEFLNSYAFLLEIRFSNKVKVQISIPVEKLDTQIPPLAVQLLIENAIKHNIFTAKNPLVIEIFVDSDNYLNVINNLQKRDMYIESTGLGLKNIENRYAYFTDRQTFFGVVGEKFVAKIPLL